MFVWGDKEASGMVIEVHSARIYFKSEWLNAALSFWLQVSGRNETYDALTTALTPLCRE